MSDADIGTGSEGLSERSRKDCCKCGVSDRETLFGHDGPGTFVERAHAISI